MPVTLFLGMALHRARSHGNATARDFVQALGVPTSANIAERLALRTPQRADNAFGTYPFEFFRISGRQDLLSDDWTYFCDRFRRAASRRRQSSAVLAIVSVFREMADNVVSHAYARAEEPCSALAAYHVHETGTSFSVIDDGQGFLCSLRKNPLWEALTTENQALDAVISKQATARIGESTGGGFKQLFNGLLNLNGLVIMRSGDASCNLRGHGSAWEREDGAAHYVGGSQVTFIVGRNANPDELPL